MKNLLFLLCFLALSTSNILLAQCPQEVLFYISKASGNFDIYKNDLNGQEIQLTQNPSWDWSPMWNEASQALIYYSYVNDTFKIQKKSPDGKALPLNTYNLEEYNLSPDGKLIVTQTKVGDNSKLVISDPDGKNPWDITPDDSYNGRAIWSPNSKNIVYISNRAGNNEVYLYQIKKDKTVRLTQNETNEKYLTWDPKSRRIAFTTQYYEEGKPDRNDVFVMNIKKKEITQITDNEYDDSEIAWSPSGDRIAFHSKRNAQDQIYTMKPDGTDVKQITDEAVYHGEPAWGLVKGKCD